MRYSILIFLFALPGWLSGQGLGPMSGSQPKSFSSLPQNIGFLDNSVNTFTGQVQFVMPLMSLQGTGNMSFPLSLSYSSDGVRENTGLLNREAPTGIAGLGWRMEVPRIVADHKGTAAREDDDFYLFERGSAKHLVFSALAGTEWEYITEEYEPWKIRYNRTSEIWTVTKEDGSKYKFGDVSSGRNTIQYMVRWGNWIGESTLTTGQQQHAYIWNLSEVVDLWGDKLAFTYLRIDESVGDGGVTHTQASYLSEIRNLAGEHLTLSYLDKYTSPAECVDNHTERNEPDAYQEKYETKYLDRIASYDESNVLLSEVRLQYGSLGTQEYYKRLLTGIQSYSSAGNALPGYAFQYETSGSGNTGALTRVTTPQKGYVNYFYSSKTLPGTNRELVVDPVAGYAEPHLYIGDDFVVISRRALNGTTHDPNGQTVRLDVFTWEGGKWLPALNLATLSAVTLTANGDGTSSQNFQFVMGKNYFATLHEVGTSGTFDVQLFRRNEDVMGQWIGEGHQVFRTYAAGNAYSGYNEPTLLAGNNFVMVGSRTPATGSIIRQVRYVKSGAGWTESLDQISVSPGNAYYTSANNFYLVYMDYVGFPFFTPDEVRLYHLDQTGQWAPPTVVAGPNGQDKAYFHASSSFGLLMANGPELIYWWDENYNNMQSFNTGTLPNGYNDYAFVDFTNNATVSIVDTPGAMAYGFTGNNWYSSGLLDYSGSSLVFRNLITYGNNFVVRPHRIGNTSYVGLTEFNPNLSHQTSGPHWFTMLDIAATNSDNLNAILAGNNYFSYSGKFYFRNPADSWNLDPTVIPYSWFKPAPDGGVSDTYLQGGLDFVATSDPYYPDTGHSAPIAINFKNGAVNPSTVSFPYSVLGVEHIWDRVSLFRPTPQAGYNTLITYFGSFSSQFAFLEDASAFKLYRKVQDGFNGPLSAFTVDRKESFDGTTTGYTNLVYELQHATMDDNGKTPFFNKVTTVEDNDTNPVTRPLGATDQFFHNGLTSQLSVSDGSFPALGGNSWSTYRKMKGLNYMIKTFDAAGNLQTQSNTDLNSSSVNGGLGYFVRPLFSIESGDGQVVRTTLVYHPQTGQLASQRTENTSDGGTHAVEQQTTYWWQVYDPSRTFNLLAPPVLQKTLKDGVVTQASAVRWRFWGANSVPGPLYNFQWRLQGNSDFTGYWTDFTPLPPASDWKLVSSISKMDENRGLVLEASNTAMMRASVWHPTKSRLWAEAEYTSAGSIYYNGFESCPSCSTDAFAGLQSGYNSSLPISMPVSANYKVTYWKKTASTWQLIQDSFTGTSYNISYPGAWIDEVRVYPAGASMTSYSHDRVGRMLSSGDANSNYLHKVYDEFGRMKMMLDTDRNITNYASYNNKN